MGFTPGEGNHNEAGSALPLILFGRYVLPAALGFERAGPSGGGSKEQTPR
ncbi:hypothetical protein NR798_18790 [Archangium gephyra]